MRPLSAALAVGAVLVVGLAIQRTGASDASRLSFLSVGQGDCAVFQHAGRTVLIDVGPKTDYFDAGERLVAPELYRLDVRTIDMILISHSDADHVGGLPAVAKRLSIGKIVIPARFKASKEMNDWLRRAAIDKQQIVWLAERTVFSIGTYTFSLDALNSPDLPEDNDGSMFVRLDGPNMSAVFSGDASSAAERAMLAKGDDWSARILKAGHHGSRFSGCMEWLEAVRPTVVVVSCGRNNTYGHPAADALSRYSQMGAVVYRTDRDGTVTFELSPSGAATVQKPR